jgi:hypothetical protein
MTGLTSSHPAISPSAPKMSMKPWPILVIVLLALAGFISPFVCFGAALVALALADQDQALFLGGTGLAHLFLSYSLLAGA